MIGMFMQIMACIRLLGRRFLACLLLTDNIVGLVGLRQIRL